MKSSNPAFNKKAFKNYAQDATSTGVMTVNGTVTKIGILLLLVMVGAAFSWSKFFGAADGTSGASAVRLYMGIGGIGGFVVALITIFNKKLAHITAPIYAVLQGLFLGSVSAFFEAMFPGLVLRAVMLTFAVLFALLFLYKARIIKVTQKFRAGVLAATMGIAVAYFASFILRLFGVDADFMFGGGTMGIVISLVIVGVAALNLVLDFDFIEKGAEAKMPGYFEWYGAFGLMVTLVWLYLEILRLLSLLTGRD